MTDFNVGDRVEVIDNIDPDYFDFNHIGATGTVVGHVEGDEYGPGWYVLLYNVDDEERAFFEGELKKREV